MVRKGLRGIDVVLFALEVLGVVLVVWRFVALVKCFHAFPWFVCV